MASPALAPDVQAFRMPAEWEPHEATWLGWPHDLSDLGRGTLAALRADVTGFFPGPPLVNEAADRARTDRDRARRLRLAVAHVAELRPALPLLVQTEAVVLSRRLHWEAPLNMALAPEDLRRAP